MNLNKSPPAPPVNTPMKNNNPAQNSTNQTQFQTHKNHYSMKDLNSQLKVQMSTINKKKLKKNY